MSAAPKPVSVPVLTWNRMLEEPGVETPFGSSFSDFPAPAIRSIRHPAKGTALRKILSIRMGEPKDVFVRDYFFAPRTPEVQADKEKNEGAGAGRPRQTFPAASVESAAPEETPFEHLSTVTRMKVPTDVIKIEDRLHYILAPPLETLLKSESLELPFAPFAYQKQGISFLYGSHFAILADEMGLGKTMQAITTMRLLLKSGECGRILLVCPKPLVPNWKRELALWAPEIGVEVIEGKASRRKWLWELSDVPIRIANYELLQRDREFYDTDEFRETRKFDLVVLDESQRIKNRRNTTFEAASAIPRVRNWALTGTPIENSSEDLVSIFEFLSPGYLTSGLKPSEMRDIVGEHILRRLKKDVLLDMPPILIRDAHIDLEGEQYESYRLAAEEGEIRLNELGDSVTMTHAFELVLRLKQICNFDPATGESAKLERLAADLDEVAQSGQKAIVFSQWVETLNRLKIHLKQYHPAEYNGRLSAQKREEELVRFKEDPDCSVILMSYGAGSVGLNLQFAEYVFLFDRWWNPAVEDQAINRAHRIGAAGPVTVTRFVCLNTIEEKIDQILEEKRLLAETVLSGARGGEYQIGLTQEDIFGLFNIKVAKRKP